MFVIIAVIIVIISLIILFFKLPGSKTKKEFYALMKDRISDTVPASGIYTEADIKNLPGPLKKYFRYCGYLGKPKNSSMKAVFKDVDFHMSNKGKKSEIKIDYTQYNFANKPERFAYIDSALYGIPFEGFDSYQNGIGSMKGVIGKVITLFDQRGEAMDKACLVTFLADCLLFPGAALQDYISWEEIDDTHAKASITYYGISAAGIFTFDNNGAMLSFRTGDRASIEMDGTTKVAEWSAVCRNYQLVNGLLQPTEFQAIWHYPEGDFVYFHGKNAKIELR